MDNDLPQVILTSNLLQAKLMELLLSNREIMRTIREDQTSGGSGDENKCNHSPGNAAKEA